MRPFKHFNQSSLCPICKTNEDRPPILIPIDDTEDDNNCEALQVHLDCINLRVKQNYNESQILFYQIVNKE